MLAAPVATETSHASGLPIAFGYTRHRRKLPVVYQIIDKVTVYPITAYDVEG